MKPIRLLLLGAGAAYLYKRFVAERGAGRAETEAAEPFSSEQLDGDGAAVGVGTPAGSEPSREEPSSDTLTQPTWLKPADG